MSGAGKGVLAKVKALLSKAKVAFANGTNSSAPNASTAAGASAPTATPTATTAALATNNTPSSSSPPSPIAHDTVLASVTAPKPTMNSAALVKGGTAALPPSPQATLHTIAAATSTATAAAAAAAATSSNHTVRSVLMPGSTSTQHQQQQQPQQQDQWLSGVSVDDDLEHASTAPMTTTGVTTTGVDDGAPAMFAPPSQVWHKPTIQHDGAAGSTLAHFMGAAPPPARQHPVDAKLEEVQKQVEVPKEHPAARSPFAVLLRDVMAGSCSGVAITLVGHPLDTVKTRLQAQSTHRMYTGTLDCIKQTLKNEGVAGFYKGAASPLCMYVLYCSVYYSSYIQARRVFGIPDRSVPAPAHLMLASSAVTGICTSFVRTPMDLLKTKAQTLHFSTEATAPAASASSLSSGAASTSSHPRHVATCTTAAEGKARVPGTLRIGIEMTRQFGPTALFQGFVPTLARQVVGAFAWFFPYEYLKQRVGDGPASVFLCGGLASWVYWTAVYPIDSVKTRIQADTADPATRRYTGWTQCFKHMLRFEGPRSFFGGFTACMLRAFPANAVGILAYELASKTIDQRIIMES
ncbi:hypothetical protein PTSG_09180 [Salpingoeca rosetta]|uniref:Uncharacterized protein n=1 Tax=Salpingoeca rosetta (strain ATCC 50818 / BSB-021) TaxID=946362 RepID=F2UMY5_SALR5|nr:uncharacterized protein PTSG_09180 [Salpingoeca rosetta]EGD78484.1 hypothetical protein PTSG_09180 [Salpingoeca rosetta]|eukprot:XP_004989433.1 hypothetical protein PTSG_09180 [Salpingoeca rosetta]